MLDVLKVRKDFPVLSRQVYGKPLVYLDNAATSQKPRQVIQSLVEYYENYNSNVHRGAHALSMEATERYEEARKKMAHFIGAASSENIVFVRNTTEAINLVACSWAQVNLRPKDEILVTEMEHHSNLVPWQQVAKKKGAKLRFIPVTSKGILDLSQLDNLLTEQTRIVSFTQMSNVLGTINPVKELVQAAHRLGAVTLVDGAQGVPHMPVNVRDLGCDFMAISGHKMLGPTGIGVLYISPQMMETMEPFLFGGEMVKEVSFDHASWNEGPLKFEAGTPNIADSIALGVAVDYLENLGMGNIRRHEVQLTDYALDAFSDMEEDVRVYGPKDTSIRGGIVAFDVNDVHPHDLSTLLDREGIAIRAGHHCAMPLTRDRLEVSATTRASFYIYNTEKEVDDLIAALKKAIKFFLPSTPKRCS